MSVTLTGVLAADGVAARGLRSDDRWGARRWTEDELRKWPEEVPKKNLQVTSAAELSLQIDKLRMSGALYTAESHEDKRCAVCNTETEEDLKIKNR